MNLFEDGGYVFSDLSRREVMRSCITVPDFLLLEDPGVERRVGDSLNIDAHHVGA